MEIKGKLDKFIFNSCSRKNGSYKTEKRARDRAATLGMDIYLCPICGRYHLTSHKWNKEEESNG